MSVRKIAGFTLFELMITVAVASLVLAFAVPAFQDFMSKSRVNAFANEVSESLAVARNTALTRRRTVYWLPSATGWTVRLDNATTGPLLENHDIKAPLTVNFNAGTVVGVTQILFQSSGLVQTQPNPIVALNGWIARVCDSGSKKEVGTDVSISPAGMITSKRHADSTTCNP